MELFQPRTWLGIGGACAFVLAHPPFGLWPLIFPALALMLAAVKCADDRGAWSRGYLMGLVIEGGGTYWLAQTVADFQRIFVARGATDSGAAWVMGLLAFAAWLLPNALLWSLWAVASAQAERSRFATWRWCGAAFALLCLDRYFPRIFSWHCGAAFGGSSTMAQLSWWTGLAGLTLPTMLLATALLRWVTRWRDASWMSRTRLGVVIAIAFLSWWGIGIARLSSAPPESERLRVGYLQPFIPLERKHGESIDEARQLLLDLLRSSRELVLREQTAVVVWPEGMIEEWKLGAHLDSTAFSRLLAEVGAPLIIGVGSALEDKRPVNRAYFLDPVAQTSIRYDKRHLLAFGERFPGRGFFESLGLELPIDFAPGTEIPTFSIAGIEAGVSICYEGILAGTARELSDRGARLHINLTEDLWYGSSGAPYQHLNLTALRALESGLPVVRVTNGGISCWIDWAGRRHDVVPLLTRGTGVFDVEILKRQTARPGSQTFVSEVLPLFWIVIALTSLVIRVAQARRTSLRDGVASK
ncbi:MAG: apolipoprotein N-acyltransferase [Planctomycetota bacterium]